MLRSAATSRITLPASLAVMTLSLAACVDGTGTAGAAAPGNAPEARGRAACTAAVRAETGNPDVSVRSSSFSEAGTDVILQVGPTGSWRCIGYSDGSTAGIGSLTDEGAL